MALPTCRDMPNFPACSSRAPASIYAHGEPKSLSLDTEACAHNSQWMCNIVRIDIPRRFPFGLGRNKTPSERGGGCMRFAWVVYAALSTLRSNSRPAGGGDTSCSRLPVASGA